MKAYFSRRYELSAAHRLFRADLSDAENSELFGKCANPHGHGHNYQVQVTVSGQLDVRTGMVCDLVALDAAVTTHVLACYDHTNLNLHGDFARLIPTTENFCMAVHQRLKGPLGEALEEVRIEETSNNAFVYAGGALPVEAQQLGRIRERLQAPGKGVLA